MNSRTLWLMSFASNGDRTFPVLHFLSIIFFLWSWPFLKGLVAESGKRKPPAMMNFELQLDISVLPISTAQQVVLLVLGQDLLLGTGQLNSHYAIRALDRRMKSVMGASKRFLQETCQNENACKPLEGLGKMEIMKDVTLLLI